MHFMSVKTAKVFDCEQFIIYCMSGMGGWGKQPPRVYGLFCFTYQVENAT